jgi:bifunctional DNA-binding transcriptional regulator/antitoxin component of YhaV-PrlF toxin-antitoxin module
MTRIGPKGQMVIQKELREQLGIGPGWHAVQEVRGDELVVRFEPPLHHRSLGGIFRAYGDRVAPPTDAEMDQAVGEAIAEEWRAKEAAGDFSA